MTRFVLDAAEYSFSTEHVHFFFSPVWKVLHTEPPFSTPEAWSFVKLTSYWSVVLLLLEQNTTDVSALQLWVFFFILFTLLNFIFSSFQLVLSKQFASEGTFRFTSLKAGRHLICLQSSSSRCPLPAGGMLVSSVQPGRSTSLHLPLMQIFKWCVVSLFL